jgi:hypothetical protein
MSAELKQLLDSQRSNCAAYSCDRNIAGSLCSDALAANIFKL